MKKPLDRLRVGVFGRGLAIGKLSVDATLGAGWVRLKTLLASEEVRAKGLREFLLSKTERLVGELGELKGSLMKAGQMLSVYGEQFLPAELNAALKTLQKDSPPLAWAAIESVIRKELGSRIELLEIETTPIGAASLGQVHRATHKKTGEVFALKVRYPGVDRAIDSDLAMLRHLLSVAGLLPNTQNLDAVFEEARTMLRQEVDYPRELVMTARYRALVGDDTRFVVPEAIEEFSTGAILCTRFEPSLAVDSPEVAALSSDRRNRLALDFLELYLKELMRFQAVQTDPHFGNFGLRLGHGGEPDRWVLYDFGAVRELSPEFVQSYRRMLQGSLLGDRGLAEEGLRQLGLTTSEDPRDYVEALLDIAELGMEGVRGPEPYAWGESDLPKRISEKGRAMLLKGRIRVPRAEMLTLDRKTSGVFVTLAKLGAVIAARPLIETYLQEPQ